MATACRDLLIVLYLEHQDVKCYIVNQRNGMGAKIFEHCDRFFSSGYVSGPENAWHECSPVVNVWDLTCTFTVVLSFVRSWSVTQSSFGPLSPSPAPPPPPPAKIRGNCGKISSCFRPLRLNLKNNLGHSSTGLLYDFRVFICVRIAQSFCCLECRPAS